jgi:alanine dehydrogenase
LPSIPGTTWPSTGTPASWRRPRATTHGARSSSAREAWAAEFVVKVKEPLPEEYPFLQRGQIVFTYLHLAANEELTRALLVAGSTAVAYETVQLADGSLPLLVPMSEIAGRMAPQVGAWCLEKPAGGRGMTRKALGSARGREACGP